MLLWHPWDRRAASAAYRLAVALAALDRRVVPVLNQSPARGERRRRLEPPEDGRHFRRKYGHVLRRHMQPALIVAVGADTLGKAQLRLVERGRAVGADDGHVARRTRPGRPRCRLQRGP